jgi:hypothetical protein
MSDSLKKFSDVLRWDFGWNQERIDQFLTSLDCSFKRFDYDAKKVEQYVDSLSKIFILRTLNGEVLTANTSKHIYVPGIMVPASQGPTGPAGSPGQQGQSGQPQSNGTANNPWTWTGPGGVTSSTGTTGTSGSGSYSTYFTTAGSGSAQIGSVTIEGDGEEKIPSFEGDVEGIVEIEEDED